MTDHAHLSSTRPSVFEDRYRLYLDESGDHVFRVTDELAHRHLCLLGCWFKNPEYLKFHASLEYLKTTYFPHHPDDPVVLHREDIVNARKAFKCLRNEDIRTRFDEELLSIIRSADFKVVAVVINKKALQDAFGEAAGHPYHLGIGFLLQRYAGYLNHINRVGDVMGEARGGKEDRLLKESFTRVIERGAWKFPAASLQSALTSRELKLKPKAANISGLQLADLLGHPVKNWVLQKYGQYPEGLAPFAQKLTAVVEMKFNHHLYKGRNEGYGYVLYPQK